MDTMQKRYRKATNDIRRNGVKFRTNVRACCRSCITEEQLGIQEGDTNYGYTYGGQGSAVSISGNKAYYQSDKSPAEEIYINYGSLDAGRIIQDAFVKNGFNVEWDGDGHSCVIITFAA